MARRLALLALVALSLAGVAEARPVHAKLRFGLMQGGSYETLRVSQETTQIPKRVHTSLPYYGFEVRIVGPEEHHVQAIFHFRPAGAPASDPSPGAAAPQESPAQTITITMQRLGVVGITHGSDDPLGHYSVDLLIDGKPWKTVEYDLTGDSDVPPPVRPSSAA